MSVQSKSLCYIRGGVWGSFRPYAKCDFGNYRGPGGRNCYQGLRLARRVT